MLRIDQQIPTQPGRGAHGADAPDEVLSAPAQRPGESCIDLAADRFHCV